MIAPQLVRVLKVGLTLIVLVVVWEIACRTFQVPSYLVPAPSAIGAKLYEKRDLYLGHTWVTLYETVAGFALAVVTGVIAAALIVVVPSVRDIIMPLLLIAQLVPKVAIAPILLIWFGYGLLSRPRLLMLDEPSLGLAPVITEQLFQIIGRIRDNGVTIFIVEQNVQTTLQIADQAYVLDQGKVVLQGAGATLAKEPRIRAAYLGM